MPLFGHHDSAVYGDLSLEAREPQDWNIGTFRTFQHLLNVVALAFDPVSSLIAIGTANGTIHILGTEAVEANLELAEPVRIKFLHFVNAASRLLCVDEKDQVHIWDLSTCTHPRYTRPRTTVRFRSPINCVTVSPSHTHAFIALESGDVQTYDLLCLRHSPYVIPNLWKMYEQKMLRSGLQHAMPPTPGSKAPIELVVHPRDLNLVFIGYEGGVVLSNLTECNTLRAYELVIPPGAVGGFDAAVPELLSHRKPSLTTLSVHPSGHFFAVGYTDGCIAFWAVEDEDKPLLVRTLDDVDVNIPNATKLEEHSSQQPEGASSGPSTVREPIFKLAWSGFPNSSDPRGGDTTLTILGGQTDGEAPGVTVWCLPAWNPKESPAADGSLTAPLREAMCRSLTPTKSYFYSTVGLTQDFLLLPRDSPHFSGTWNPSAILIVSEAEEGTRAVGAFEFAPGIASNPDASSPKSPRLPNPSGAPVDNTTEQLADELASTLESMELDGDPKSLILPPVLWSGNQAVVRVHLVMLDRNIYEKMIPDTDSVDSCLHLRGGFATLDAEVAGNDMKFAKYQPRRLILTEHRDLTIKFLDVSAQLLMAPGSGPMRKGIPHFLPSLTIDLTLVLADPSLSAFVPSQSLMNARIRSVHLATESLECSVVLDSGVVIVFKFDAHAQSTLMRRELSDPELVSLEHLKSADGSKFQPLLMIAGRSAPAVSVGTSDIGLLAASYADGSLLIIDMRGSKVILRNGSDTRKRMSFIKHSDDADVMSSLTWTVCRTDTDPAPRIRLLAVHKSGKMQVFTLRRSTSSGAWVVGDQPLVVEALPQPIYKESTFVIEALSGNRCKANSHGFSFVAQTAQDAAQSEDKNHCYLITAGEKGVKCTLNIDGDRVGRTEWGSKVGKVERVELVEKNGSHALIAFTNRQEALVYSVPHMEHIHTFSLPQLLHGPISPDPTGDFLELTLDPASKLVARVTLSTFFDIRRSYYRVRSDVDLLTRSDTGAKGIIPPQPQPVSMGPQSVLGSWFGSLVTKSMTGDQIDALLAGPDRPEPKLPVDLTPKPPASDSKKPSPSGSGPRRSTSPVAAEGASSSLYNRLTSALNERGEALGSLEEQFNSLEEGSRSMVSQAKRLAAEQSGKKWFNFN